MAVVAVVAVEQNHSQQRFHSFAFPSPADIACTESDFSTICSLVQLAGLDTILSAGGPFTIFLPNDDAFDNLDPDLIDFLTDNANREVLEEVLLNHVVAATDPVFEADLVCEEAVPKLSGETTTTVCDGGNVFQVGQGNLALNDLFPQVVDTDTEACNGVVHEVNNVILPQSVADLLDALEDGDSPDFVEPACSPNIGKK